MREVKNFTCKQYFSFILVGLALIFLLSPALGASSISTELNGDKLEVKLTFPESVRAKLYIGVAYEDELTGYPNWRWDTKWKDCNTSCKFQVNLEKFKLYTFPKYTIYLQGYAIGKRVHYTMPLPVRIRDVNGRLSLIPIRRYMIAGIYGDSARFVIELTNPQVVKLKVFDKNGNLIRTVISKRDSDGKPQPAELHDITVTKLKPGTYSYSFELISSGNVETPRFSFKVAGEEFRFTVLGDSRKPPISESLEAYNGVSVGTLKRIFTDALDKGTDIIFINGDLISGYTEKWEDAALQFETFKAQIEPIVKGVPVYPIPGNHDLSSPWESTNRENIVRDPSGPDSAEAHWAELWYLPENAPTPPRDHPPTKELIYSFNYGNSHFISLCPFFGFVGYRHWRPGLPKIANPMWNRIEKFQLRWLEEDLARAEDKAHKFIFVHVPPYPVTGHYVGRALDANPQERDELIRIASRYGVDVIFVAHEHVYARLLIDKELSPVVSKPIWEIEDGRAGAPFRPVAENLKYKDHLRTWYIGSHYSIIKVIGEKLYLETYNEWGKLIDSTRLK